MSDYSLQEFRDFFNQLSYEYGIPRVYTYMKAVETSINEYLYSGEKKQNIVIPEKYLSNVMEYFILLHFIHFYLEGLMHSRSIENTLSKVDGVENVSIFKDNREVYKQQISFGSSKNLNEEFMTLRSLFIEIGRSLLGDRFSIDDFINYK